MQELSTGSAKLSTLDLGVLTALNLAHELALVRQELATLKEDQESRQEEINQRVSSLVSQVKQVWPELLNLHFSPRVQTLW